MNVKEAKEILIKATNPHAPIAHSDVIGARCFLECHELYKPLVDALEKISTICHGDGVVYSRVALEHYRKNILGEK